MREREPIGVERLTGVRRARFFQRAVHVLPLADERVASHGGLNANLVALAGVQPHLDE